MKNRISLDLSNMEAFKELTDIQLGELMRAVFAYASEVRCCPRMQTKLFVSRSLF